MTATATCTKSVKGTEIEVGMTRHIGYLQDAKVTAVEQCQHPMGARFAIVSLDNGKQETCWEGFLYRVNVYAE